MKVVGPLAALLISFVSPLEAQVTEESHPLPVSIERVREQLATTFSPQLKLDLDVLAPIAVFKATVERDYVPSFKEELEKEFTLNEFQRQSQEWASKPPRIRAGVGVSVDLIWLVDTIDKFLKKREARKIREQVARELAQIEAAAKK